MRTSDERIAELHKRMDTLKKEKDLRVFRIWNTVAVAAAFALAIGLAVLIAKLPFKMPETEMSGAAASIFAENEALGIIVAAILAFTLGVMVTVLCFRLKKHQEEKQNNDSRDH